MTPRTTAAKASAPETARRRCDHLKGLFGHPTLLASGSGGTEALEAADEKARQLRERLEEEVADDEVQEHHLVIWTRLQGLTDSERQLPRPDVN